MHHGMRVLPDHSLLRLALLLVYGGKAVKGSIASTHPHIHGTFEHHQVTCLTDYCCVLCCYRAVMQRQ
jgi:hypothetical protein